jgi:hypothetical protein
MRNTNEVIEAVRIGGDVTEKELRYAVRNLSIWQNTTMLSLAMAVTEEIVTAKTRRRLERAYETARNGNAVPLDIRLEGGSFEPGISRDESIHRASSQIADAAVKIVNILGGAKAR